MDGMGFLANPVGAIYDGPPWRPDDQGLQISLLNSASKVIFLGEVGGPASSICDPDWLPMWRITSVTLLKGHE